MTTSRLIVITGFMGCGKTEVARSLAERLNATMADLDDVITESVGRSPGELISEEGERAFRVIESEVLEKLLGAQGVSVIALGGGAWIEKTNRDLLSKNGAISIWLDTPFDVCWERIQRSAEDRPLGRSREQALQLYERRLPVYSTSTIRLHAELGDPPDALAAIIEDKINRI